METPIYQDQNGYRYIVIFMRDLSQQEYTRKQVYHIFTDNTKWCGRILPSILNDESMSSGEYDFQYEQNPTIENYLRKHHKVEFIDHPHEKYDFSSIGIDSTGYYEYTVITPYDD